MRNLTEVESLLRERLEELKPVPPRNPQAAARARARFVADVRAAREARQRWGWGFIFRKQQFAMNMIVALAVIVGLFVGGGTTVRAAQDDLPNEPLYGIKTLSEDISLQFQRDPEAKVERLMELSQTRVQEMTQLVESGQTPPEQVLLRLEQHMQEALQICSDMDDATLDRALSQVRDRLQKQEQDMQRLQSRAAQSAHPILEHTRSMLQTQLHVVNDGLVDHQAFRDTVHDGLQVEQTETPTASLSPTPLPEQSGQATPPPDAPGNSNGLGPSNNPSESNAHVTPTPKAKEPKPTQEPKETKEPKPTKAPKTEKPPKNEASANNSKDK
jgi:hypothetical protein